MSTARSIAAWYFRPHDEFRLYLPLKVLCLAWNVFIVLYKTGAADALARFLNV